MLAPFWDTYRNFGNLSPQEQNAAIVAIRIRTIGTALRQVGEGQAWLAEQIARENYDPNVRYSPDAVRIATGLATAALGMTTPC